ncbi:MAG: hypothetical protein WBQ72_04115, partial [Terriglobales bacterium]
MKHLAKILLSLAILGAVLAQAQTLLLDNFTKDSSLNTNLWTANSPFLTALAASSSSPAATFVPPQLSF